MRKIAIALGVALSFFASAAFAQSSPGLTYGQVPTAGQWNNYFASKQDYLGAAPCLVTGCVMSGELFTAASVTAHAGFSIPPGVAPTTPADGEMWATASGLYVQVNGTTIGPLSGATGSSFAATSPILVTFPAGVVTYAFDFTVANTFLAQQTNQGATTTSPGWYAQITGDTVPRVRVGLNATDIPSIAFGSGSGNRDAFIERVGAGAMRFGAPDAAAPVAQTISVQNVVAGTSNTAGAALTVSGSQGTGTGVGGSILFKVAPAGSTGSTQNALATALTIDSTKLAIFAGHVSIEGTTSAGATGTGNLMFATAPTMSAATVTGSFTATGLVTNADLVSPTITVNTVACTLGSSCTITATAASITVGTTLVNGGSTGRVPFDNAGTLGEYPITGSAGSVVLSTSPTIASPTLSGTLAGNITISGNNTYSGTTNLTGAVSVTSTSFGLTGNISAAAWTTSGLRYKNIAGTMTDTSSSGTVAAAYTNLWGGNTIAATSVTTFTNYFETYFQAPVAGSNAGLTNAWAIGADSAKIGTSNQLTVTAAGLVTVPGTLNVSGTFQLSGVSVTTVASTTQYAAVKIDNSTIQINGSGQIFSAGSSATAITPLTTAISGGTAGRFFTETNSGCSGSTPCLAEATATGSLGSVVLSSSPTIATATFTGTTSAANATLTSSSANALAVGQGGTTNPAFQVDASAGSATGIKIASASSGNGVTLSTISSNANETLTLSAKGSGVIQLSTTNAAKTLFGTTSACAITQLTGFGDVPWCFGPSINGTNVFYVYNGGASAGVFLTNGGNTWSSSSDERLKNIIAPISGAVANLATLRTVDYRYKTDDEKVIRLGLLAQDVEKVYPECVNHSGLPLASGEPTLGLSYECLIPALVAAVNELAKRPQ